MVLPILTPAQKREARAAPVRRHRLRHARASRASAATSSCSAGSSPPSSAASRSRSARSTSSSLPDVIETFAHLPGGPRPRHRPDRLGQVDDARRDHQARSPRRGRSTSSRSRTRSSTSSTTTRPRSRSARSGPTRRASPRRLKNAMRQDPDVIMVGEMRDWETMPDRDHRGRDGPPRLLDAAHEQRRPDDRPHHRRVSRRSSRTRSARQLALVLRAIVSMKLIETVGRHGPDRRSSRS